MFGEAQDLLVAVGSDVGALQRDDPRAALDVLTFIQRPVHAVLRHLGLGEQTHHYLHLIRSKTSQLASFKIPFEVGWQFYFLETSQIGIPSNQDLNFQGF